MRALVLASLVASAAAVLASPELRDWPLQLATPAAVKDVTGRWERAPEKHLSKESRVGDSEVRRVPDPLWSNCCWSTRAGAPITSRV